MNSTYSIYASKNRFNFFKGVAKTYSYVLENKPLRGNAGGYWWNHKIIQGIETISFRCCQKKLYVLEQNVPNVEIFGGFIVVSF